MQDELEARKNAGHQDMKAALPDVSFGRTWDGIRTKSEDVMGGRSQRLERCCARHGPFWVCGNHTDCPYCVLNGGGEVHTGTVTTEVRLNPQPKPPVPVFMSTDSAVRKLMPVATGCLKYFPDALLLVAWVSRAGNDKHNPGQPLHWAKEKSTDQSDCEVRHMLDHFRGVAPDPGLEPLGDLGHLASKAWRALADLQTACDEKRKAVAK